MRVIYCSDYLVQQESTSRAASHEAARALRRMPRQPRGCLSLLLALVSGKLRERRGQRQQYLNQLQKEAGQWKAGRKGEEDVARVLRWRLNRHYVLLRNYVPPPPWRSGGDIDGVLLGPHGVTVLEVKAVTGMFLCRGRDWLQWSRPDEEWQPATIKPTQQALYNAERIRATLRLQGQGEVHVRPIVAIASLKMQVVFEQPPEVPVFFACSKKVEIDSIVGHAQEQLSDERVRQLVSALMPARQAG